MLERLSKTKRNFGLVAVAILLLWGGWAVRNVLNPLILGYLLAYILRPFVAGLEERGMGRRMAVNIIFSVFAIVFTATGVGVIVQAKEVVDRVMSPTAEGEDPIAVAEQRINAVLSDAKAWVEGLFSEDEASGDEDAPEEGGSGESANGAETGDPAPPSDQDDVEPRPGAGDQVDTGGTVGADRSVDVESGDDGLTIRRLLRNWVAEVTDQVEESGGATAFFSAAFNVLMRVFGGVLSIFGFLVLLPVYTYFLLFELERIHEFVRLHVPKKERERVTRIACQVGDVVANFFRGRLLICFIKGSVLALGLAIADVPHAFLLGMTSGFLALVPFVGPTLGFVVTYLFALQRMEVVEAAIWVAPVFMIAEALEGYVLIPKILGDSLGLHPVVILLAVFVGGSALGLFGFLIAVPLAATAIILFRELVMPAVEDFAEEDSHVDEEPAAPA